MLVDPGALQQSAELLAEKLPRHATVWVLSDENTEAAAAARWKRMSGAFRLVSRVLPGRPMPVPTAELVERLAADARGERPELLVSVGGGVISDLVKSISLALGTPNWCIATAPSVDAFSSPTSALRVQGFHGSVPARTSETIVCDPEVVRGAPHELFLAGLGDLLAKYLAHLDWNISRMMTGEQYCPVVASVALDSARSALAAARLLREDPAEAVRTLMDAVLSSGFAMQATGGSRPAASAEHTIAHCWESTDAARTERLALHGILAAAASRMVFPVYRALHERLVDFEPDDHERLLRFDAEPGWQDAIETGLEPFRARIAEEMGGKAFDRGILARRLYAFREHRPEIAALARSMLDELAAAVETLESMHYPFSFELLGLRREDVMLPFRNVRVLRRRYSGFDLAYELGLDSLMIEEGEKYLAGAA